MHVVCERAVKLLRLMFFQPLLQSQKRGSEGVESKTADSSQNTSLSVLQVHPVEKGCCSQRYVSVGSLP